MGPSGLSGVGIMVDILQGGDRNALKHRAWVLVSVFTLSIFLSAFLLFSVQPMFTKLVLPLLGGSSNVWNTAMVFFQGVLLAGYIYAHLISKYLALKWQVVCHTLVLISGLLFLPLAIAAGWTPPREGAQAFWLLGLFGASVGLPFFAISANAPLLQRWFSRTNDKDAQDPYFLYAASNVGSLLSLFLYPVLFEPMLVLQEQTGLWSAGYVVLIGVIAAAGITAFRNPNLGTIHEELSAPSAKPLTASSRALWVFLAFIPSSLMLGLTSHMTQNIASSPFLWILPLGLYLLTFIIVFAKKPLVTTQGLTPAFALSLVLAIVAGFVLKHDVIISIGLSLCCYFVIALYCHSRLADRRPDVSHLTEFYIWMSLGGVLGGIFNALIAPIAFNNVYEFLGVLLLATFAVSRQYFAGDVREYLYMFSLRFLMPACVTVIGLSFISSDTHLIIIIAAVIILLGLNFKPFRAKMLPLSAAVFIGLCLYLPLIFQKSVHTERSFFGLLRVTQSTSDYGTVHVFGHGDTVHNFQLQEPENRRVPLAYYAVDNSFDKAIKAVRSRKGAMSAAIIGLGAGALACHEQAGDDWTYFEIDPAVVDVALNPAYFSYMQECAPNAKIITGDARLTITDLPKNSQDLIVIDAFSSDSIPTHLLTQEALAVYQSRLKDDGIMFFHTTNRVMDVSSVVVKTAQSIGLDARFISRSDFSGHEYEGLVEATKGVMVGNAADIESITAGNPVWETLTPSMRIKAWTDSYSPVIGAIRAKMETDAASIK